MEICECDFCNCPTLLEESELETMICEWCETGLHYNADKINQAREAHKECIRRWADMPIPDQEPAHGWEHHLTDFVDYL